MDRGDWWATVHGVSKSHNLARTTIYVERVNPMISKILEYFKSSSTYVALRSLTQNLKKEKEKNKGGKWEEAALKN